VTRIVTTRYRTKRPPRKRKPVAIEGPVIVTPKRKEAPPLDLEAKVARPAVVRKAKPGNDNRPDVLPQNKPAIVTAKPKRRLPDGPPLPMELPLSRRPVERDGEDYKRLKAAMARRMRGE
jgi:hypothetical protein